MKTKKIEETRKLPEGSACVMAAVVAMFIFLAAMGTLVWGFNNQAEAEPVVPEARQLDMSKVNDIMLDEELVETVDDSIDEAVEEEVIEEPVVEEVYYEPAYTPVAEPTYVENGSGLTKSGGVNWHDGRRETWYSSNVLYHYRTPEWTVGADGVYRDADGYVVVAASDLAHGSTVSTSFGEGKVYDTGCAPGTTDIYTAW